MIPAHSWRASRWAYWLRNSAVARWLTALRDDARWLRAACAGQTWTGDWTAATGDRLVAPAPVRPVRTYEWNPDNPAPNEMENLDVYVSSGTVARQADAYLARIGWRDTAKPQATT